MPNIEKKHFDAAGAMAEVFAAKLGADAKKIVLTCRWKGETGNDIDLRFGYYEDERPPVGFAAAIAQKCKCGGLVAVTPALREKRFCRLNRG